MFKKTGWRVQKPKICNPQADFALNFDMITKEEYIGIIEGNAKLDNRVFANLNLDLPYLLTGERTTIYKGRGSDIMIDRLLSD